jgi:2-aminoadipate transaminase
MPIPSIAALETEWIYYVGSFSKILGPSLRIGWIVAPQEQIQILSSIKEGVDLNVSTLAQWIVTEFLDREDLALHIDCLRTAYRKRRNTMDIALREHMPRGVQWEMPGCGIFFWLTLPSNIDSSELLTNCIINDHVAFLPSQACSRNQFRNGLRLNFSHCSESLIELGVERIAQGLRRAMA